MGSAKVGPKGQIVIPKVRDMFDISPGDTIIVLADEKGGLQLKDSIPSTKLPMLFFRERQKNYIYEHTEEDSIIAKSIRSMEGNKG